MEANYFVCTLGQAAFVNTAPKPYRTISEFISHQACQNGQLPAVGFPIPDEDPAKWNYKILTFEDIDRGVRVLAGRLVDTCGPSMKIPQTVALLSHSSPEFIFTWLALIRLGHAVLLIAPQCQASAIMHLCKTCQASTLLHDVAHSNRAKETVCVAKDESWAGFSAQTLPLRSEEDIFQVIEERPTLERGFPPSDNAAVAYLHHTSGTSSGLPKPIPQSHRAAIGALPHLPKTPSQAAFTTTPLYHGGIADLFRAWTSDALIWLFPSKDVPITARNICLSLDTANQYSKDSQTSVTKYFSSVPYVLQMMEADKRGLPLLKSMEIVGVGGAALPAEVGDRLVDHGVNLISRYGSAECGFLLSSYRDFGSDRDWQYLRDANPPKLLEFEDRDDGLSELIVKPGWPHMATTNRPDGSFGTADLFAPHSMISKAWLYHSRADSQLTLITGKKFDPAPLEAAIATSPLLDDVLIFGNNRSFPGVLLLRSAEAAAVLDAELLQDIRPTIERLNRESQDHTRMPQNMLVPLPHQTEPLEKSSKGTIIRKAAEDRFKVDIDSAYERLEAASRVSIEDKKLPEHLISLVKSIISQSRPLEEGTDLFAYGMDSVACMQLRSHLRHLVPNEDEEMPLSVVEDCGTVRDLSRYIVQKRHGESNFDTEDEEQLMLKLVEEHSSFNSCPQAEFANDNHRRKSGSGSTTVLLTGATGGLGAHVLHLLRKSSNTARIYCLVRGANAHAATERVSEALESRGLGGLSADDAGTSKIEIIQAQLSDAQLGLSDAMYNRLAAEVDLIIHVAWTVNFRLKLRNFVKDNVAGVRYLLDLALADSGRSPPNFVYCSSTAAVMNADFSQFGFIPEQVITYPSSASPLGYSRSKWVAEQICYNANQQTRLKGHVAILRVGQLSGDSGTGIWNTKEAWPMMLSTMKLTGSLPELPNEILHWLPVDIAAQALLEAGQTFADTNEHLNVYHVLNEHQRPTWSEMLQWLRKKEDFEIVSPAQWVARLERCEDTGHPALKLLGLWKDAYCGTASEAKGRPRFSMNETKRLLPTLRDVQPVSEEYMAKIWYWVHENVH